MSRWFSLSLLPLVPLLLALSSPVERGSQAPIGDEEFARLHREIRPSPDEPWRRVPWKLSLLEARPEAARQERPMFIWAMDGHPLGCT